MARRRLFGLAASIVGLAIATLLGISCTAADEQPDEPPPSGTPTRSTAVPSATVAVSPTATTTPTIAPNGRTPDPELNALIESLLGDDAEKLRQAFGYVGARAQLQGGAEVDLPPDDWSEQLATAHRSLYAVVRGDPQVSPPRDYDVVLAAGRDGKREGWRFAFANGRIVDLYIGAEPSVTVPSVAGAYDQFVVLPPVEELPRPPTGYSFEFDVPGTGDAEVDALVGLLAGRDRAGLLAAVDYDGGTLPVRPCGGTRGARDASVVESWLGTVAEQAYSLHAIANVPDGYSPAAEHLLVVTLHAGPLAWEEAGLLESEGRIVGLQAGCVSYPPRAFIVGPPPDGTEELDLNTRSGIESVDAVLDALAAKERAPLLALIDFAKVGCVTESLGIGSPPTCRESEVEGTPVDVLPSAGCEGVYSRSDEVDWLIDLLLGADWRVYAVTDDGVPTSGAAFGGGVWLVLASRVEGEQPYVALRLSVSERGIAMMLTGCGPESPDQMTYRFGGTPDFLLAPPAARSALWLINVENGHKVVLHEGESQAAARFAPDGQSVSALLHLEDDRYRALRYDLAGQVIEQYDDRSLITTSPNGASRFFRLLQSPQLDGIPWVLEHKGEAVAVGVASTGTYGVAFSPDSSLLLLGAGEAVSSSEVVFTYHVVSVATGESRFSFETHEREGTDGGEMPRWSPSGRYIAARGQLDGLRVHDTATGESVLLGAGLSRWSPAEDAILALDADGNLDVVRFPGAGRVRIAAAPGNAPRFDQSGRFAYWEDPPRSSVTIADTTDGRVVAVVPGRLTDFLYPGVSSVTTSPAGTAVLVGVANDDCRGLQVHLLDTGHVRCLEGAVVARWSPNGQQLAYAAGDELRVLDVETDDTRLLARGVDSSIYGDAALMRWSRDGARLLVQWPSGGMGWSEE